MIEFVFNWVYNIVGKGENAGDQHFLMATMFLKGFFLQGSLTLYHTILTFNNLETRSLLKTLWEKEKMLVTTMFSTLLNINFNFLATSILLSTNTFNSDVSKILSFGQGLNTRQL